MESTFKKIIMDGSETHSKKLAEELDRVQARATARTITPDKVLYILGRVEKYLGIPKKHLKGTRICYDGAQHFPSAYRFIPQSTYFCAEHNGKAWTITSIGRDTCPNRLDDVSITLSDTAKDALIKSRSTICS